MDQSSAIAMHMSREQLHQHVRHASREEKIAALRHVRRFIAAEQRARDSGVAAAEALVPSARQAVADARAALAQAQAAESEVLSRADSAKQKYSVAAAVLELRVEEYYTPNEIAAADPALNQEAATA